MIDHRDTLGAFGSKLIMNPNWRKEKGRCKHQTLQHEFQVNHDGYTRDVWRCICCKAVVDATAWKRKDERR